MAEEASEEIGGQSAEVGEELPVVAEEHAEDFPQRYALPPPWGMVQKN